MASQPNTTTRRALLGAIAAIPALALAAPALADPPTEPNDDRLRHFNDGMEIGFLFVARAWLDRWHALGGNFSVAWKPGQPGQVMIGHPMPYAWTPSDDWGSGMAPHLWLGEGDHTGAVKALQGLLALVPGLREAVFEIGGRRALAASAGPPDGGNNLHVPA